MNITTPRHGPVKNNMIRTFTRKQYDEAIQPKKATRPARIMLNIPQRSKVKVQFHDRLIREPENQPLSSFRYRNYSTCLRCRTSKGSRGTRGPRYSRSDPSEGSGTRPHRPLQVTASAVELVPLRLYAEPVVGRTIDRNPLTENGFIVHVFNDRLPTNQPTSAIPRHVHRPA